MSLSISSFRANESVLGRPRWLDGHICGKMVDSMQRLQKPVMIVYISGYKSNVGDGAVLAKHKRLIHSRD